MRTMLTLYGKPRSCYTAQQWEEAMSKFLDSTFGAGMCQFLPGSVTYHDPAPPPIYTAPRQAECKGCGAPMRMLHACEYCRRPA